ncbi:MAG: MEKHLA domain-containing protein [Prevotella sp.]|jgi:PAS domain-containing protein|nr:MEKHLA domain-containing protein [Prevotella sp.]
MEEKSLLIRQIDDCFYKLSGKRLPTPHDITDRYQWLDEEAPYSILAHNANADPHFIYANKYALSCFKYTLEEMLSLHSRLSAADEDRAERAQLLQIVTCDGIAYNYSGPRIDKYGSSFNIYDGIVWQLKDEESVWGQGALFWTEEYNRPDWYK